MLRSSPDTGTIVSELVNSEAISLSVSITGIKFNDINKFCLITPSAKTGTNVTDDWCSSSNSTFAPKNGITPAEENLKISSITVVLAETNGIIVPFEVINTLMFTSKLTTGSTKSELLISESM